MFKIADHNKKWHKNALNGMIQSMRETEKFSGQLRSSKMNSDIWKFDQILESGVHILQIEK